MNTQELNTQELLEAAEFQDVSDFLYSRCLESIEYGQYTVSEIAEIAIDLARIYTGVEIDNDLDFADEVIQDCVDVINDTDEYLACEYLGSLFIYTSKGAI